VANLYITLGGGFKDHQVRLDVSGREIFNEAGITSSPLTDLARELPPVPVSNPQSVLDVTARGAGASQPSTASCALATDKDMYVVVYIDIADGKDDAIRIAARDKPYGFG
jgi:hypothetical protein